MLCGRNKEKLEFLKTSLENKYVHLQKTINFTNDIGEALTFSNIILVAILSQGFRNFYDSIKHLTGIASGICEESFECPVATTHKKRVLIISLR